MGINAAMPTKVATTYFVTMAGLQTQAVNREWSAQDARSLPKFGASRATLQTLAFLAGTPVRAQVVKCLVTADLHYNLRQFDWVLGVAGDFDIVILAGDHLDMFSTVDGRAQSVVVGKYLERLAPMTRLLICSGNHDLDSRDGTGEKTARWVAGFRALGIPTDDDTVVVEDTFFSICPWWDGPAAKE
jgi:hypothetical protein